jgi:hypothetical protein
VAGFSVSAPVATALVEALSSLATFALTSNALAEVGTP